MSDALFDVAPDEAGSLPSPWILPSDDKPAASGVTLKEQGLQAVQQPDANAEWLQQARAWAKTYLLEHPDSTVTAEQVRDAVPLPDSVSSHNIVGSLFRGGEFRRVGYRQAGRDAAHARVISVWALA